MKASIKRFLDTWGSRLLIAWAAFFAIALALLFILMRGINVESFKMLPWNIRFLALNIPVIFATFFVTKYLMRAHRFFRWTPSDLFVKTDPKKKAGVSVLMLTMNAKYVGSIVAILLLINLPVIALLEEFIFRNGTADWTDAVWRNALFGLAHLTANVPVAAAITTGAVGFWFTHWYFKGGIELSGLVHFCYIFIIVALSLPTILKKHSSSSA